jgi:hypothetical protein
VFDTIEAEPDRLREVTGIGPVRAKRITDAWAEQKVVREIMVFLHEHGVGTARAVRIFKTYGADAVQVMTENPYRLARDIRGIGFKTADAIAMKLGIEKTAMIRVRAGISFALTEAMDEGHCGLPSDELIPLAEELLEVPPELIRTALDLELSEGTVIADRVGAKVQPKRSTLRSPAGFKAAWSSMLSERAPTPPRFIGQSTWMSRIGSRPKRLGIKAGFERHRLPIEQPQEGLYVATTMHHTLSRRVSVQNTILEQPFPPRPACHRKGLRRGTFPLKEC